MEKLLRRVKKKHGSSKSPSELSRSQYSLVSCTDLTPGAVELWMGLPDEVKYDPYLNSFRQKYEKEYGITITSNNNGTPNIGSPNTDTPNTGKSKQRLPQVNSAPHITNTEIGNHVTNQNERSQVYQPIGSDRLEDNANNLFRDSSKGNTNKQEDISNVTLISTHVSKFKRLLYLSRIGFLVAFWIFFTVIFFTYNEHSDVRKITSVTNGETKSLVLNFPDENIALAVEIRGPFMAENAQEVMNSTLATTAKKLDVWLERWHLKDDGIPTAVNESDVLYKEASEAWEVFIRDPYIDIADEEYRSSIIRMNSANDTTAPFVYAVKFKTDSERRVPFTMTYEKSSFTINTGLIWSLVLLLVLYSLICFELINRTLAAVVVSTLSLAVLCVAGQRPTVGEIVSWLDFETLILLFSMMVTVAITAETGLFDFVAVYTYEKTKGKMWPMITWLCLITAVLSTFLDNVTTVLLMAPVTIRLCEVTDLDPIPVLMSMCIFSNIGGTATPVGDPPNIIVASNVAVRNAGINFLNFTCHMTLGIILVGIQCYLQLRINYRDPSKLRNILPRDVQDLQRQIQIWSRARESIGHMSKDELVVRQRLQRKISKLSTHLDELTRTSKTVISKDSFLNVLEELKRKYRIRDKILLLKSGVAVVFVILVFFLHSVPIFQRISLGWTALLGAILLLILADRADLEPVMHKVEWSTLIFFAALFVLMEALNKLGFIDIIGELTETIILNVSGKGRLAVAILLLLWVSGVASAFVDNIPLTTMMVRVVASMGNKPQLELPMAPLIWALCFGACLGGNGTLIGASANVVCAGVADQHGYHFTFGRFFKFGFPLMIGHLCTASVYLMICHVLFEWH